MRIVLSYGKAAGLEDCAKLYAMIEGMDFRKESDEKRIGKAKPKKKVAMTYAQAEAIVRKGLETGLCHEQRRSKRRCVTVREMKEGPSSSAIRC